MGNKQSRKVQPARVESSWVETHVDHDGNQIYFNASRREYFSVEHGSWYTQSMQNIIDIEQRYLPTYDSEGNFQWPHPNKHIQRHRVEKCSLRKKKMRAT